MPINCYPIISPPASGVVPRFGGALRRIVAGHGHGSHSHGVGVGHAGHVPVSGTAGQTPVAHALPVYGPPVPQAPVHCVRVPGGALPAGPGGGVAGGPGTVGGATGGTTGGTVGGAAGGVSGLASAGGLGTAAKAALVAGGLGLAGLGAALGVSALSSNTPTPPPYTESYTPPSTPTDQAAPTLGPVPDNGRGPEKTPDLTPTDTPVVAVPEPTTMLLLGFGAMATALSRRRGAPRR